MLSRVFHCTALAEYDGRDDVHVATIVDEEATSDLMEGQFTSKGNTLRILVPANAIIVGKKYVVRIEEAKE